MTHTDLDDDHFDGRFFCFWLDYLDGLCAENFIWSINAFGQCQLSGKFTGKIGNHWHQTVPKRCFLHHWLLVRTSTLMWRDVFTLIIAMFCAHWTAYGSHWALCELHYQINVLLLNSPFLSDQKSKWKGEHCLLASLLSAFQFILLLFNETEINVKLFYYENVVCKLLYLIVKIARDLNL